MNTCSLQGGSGMLGTTNTTEGCNRREQQSVDVTNSLRMDKEWRNSSMC